MNRFLVACSALLIFAFCSNRVALADTNAEVCTDPKQQSTTIVPLHDDQNMLRLMVIGCSPPDGKAAAISITTTNLSKKPVNVEIKTGHGISVWDSGRMNAEEIKADVQYLSPFVGETLEISRQLLEPSASGDNPAPARFTLPDLNNPADVFIILFIIG